MEYKHKIVAVKHIKPEKILTDTKLPWSVLETAINSHKLSLF